MSRPISDAWIHRIKAATRDLVERTGGVERASTIALVGKSTISRWCVASEPDVISISAALSLEKECGMPLVTAVMADIHGRQLTEGDHDGGNAATILRDNAEAIRAAAELMATAANAMDDGKITATEAEVIDRRAGALEAAIVPLRASCAAAKNVIPLKREG